MLVLALGVVVTACSPSRKELMAELDEIKGQLDQAQADNATLRQQITKLEGDVAAQQGRIDELVAQNEANAAELAELRAAKAEREKELEVYKNLFAKLKKLIDAGTIKVVFREGKMIVEMSSAVLFDSGRADLKEDGLATLDEITQALMTVKDRDFLVAGHTDDIPIKTRRFPSNWELSTQRAVVVVKHMIDQGFPRDHIGAAGYAHVDPVGDNQTEEGRAANRRIEIILVPNLGELKGIREMLEG